jgi:hypothetical protein
MNKPKIQKIFEEKADHAKVWQDKGVFTCGRRASHQPDPPEKRAGAQELDTKLLRAQKKNNRRVKLIHRTLHLPPLDDAELKHIASQDGLSVSSVGAAAVHAWLLLRIHQREENLLYPKLRQLLREDRQQHEDHALNLQMHAAIASEQARILATEILKRLLFLIAQFVNFLNYFSQDKKPEKQAPTMEIFDEIVNKSYKMARANVFRKSAERRAMAREWKDNNNNSDAVN